MPAHRARRAGRDDGPPQWPTLERGAPLSRFLTLLSVENPRYRLQQDSSATPVESTGQQGFACAGGSAAPVPHHGCWMRWVLDAPNWRMFARARSRLRRSPARAAAAR